ncbi:hypothetical protein COI93_09500 [Bacillus cereus]|uniref:YunG n=1 Tax=Bacillus cereus TaxID=1396 RepID=A0A2B0MIK3_BACCE|nr:hypothetical protein COI93_09500 [Bacillus cereus]
MRELKIAQVQEILINAWSIETSSKWTRENPAKGQCGVTALVVHDLLGGEIRKTRVGEAWHFYNMLDDKRYDFTASQFSEKIIYMDASSNREEAFADTDEKQYKVLKERVASFQYYL